MFTVALLIVSLITLTVNTPVRIKEYKLNGAEGASLGKFISDYINQKVPQTWMDDEADFDIFNIVGKYENLENLDEKYDLSTTTDSEDEDDDYVTIGHEVVRPTVVVGEENKGLKTKSAWAEALLEPLLNYSKLLKKITDETTELIENKELPSTPRPNKSEDEGEEISFSDLYQSQDKRRKRFAPDFKSSLNFSGSNSLQFGPGIPQMSLVNQYPIQMQVAPVPMAMPIPVPAVVPPFMVPARTYFEPVIHDHPHPNKIKKIIQRDRRKYELSSSSETDEDFNDCSDDED